MPCGRNIRIRIRISSAVAYLKSPGSHEVRQLDDDADDQRADQGPEGRAEAAEGDRREDQQQDLQAGHPVDAVEHEAEHDAREAGETGGERPDEPDDPVDVDARGRGEGRVVARPRGSRGRCGSSAGTGPRRPARRPRSPIATYDWTVSVTPPNVDRRRVVAVDAHRAGAVEVLEGVLQGDREADGDDHQLREAEPALPQGLPDQRGPGGSPVAAADDDRDEHRGQDQRQPDRARTSRPAGRRGSPARRARSC